MVDLYMCLFYFVQDKDILKGFHSKHNNGLYKFEKVTLLFKISENRVSYREKVANTFGPSKFFQ